MGTSKHRKKKSKPKRSGKHTCGPGCGHHQSLPHRVPIGTFCYAATLTLRAALPLTTEQREAAILNAIQQQEARLVDFTKRLEMLSKVLVITNRLPGGEILARAGGEIPSDLAIFCAGIASPLISAGGVAEFDAAELLELCSVIDQAVDVEEFFGRFVIEARGDKVYSDFDDHSHPVPKLGTTEGKLYDAVLASIAIEEGKEQAKDLFWEEGLLLAINFMMERPEGQTVADYALSTIDRMISDGTMVKPFANLIREEFFARTAGRPD